MPEKQPKPDLKIDWCSYEAAKYAVEHWHYSRSMPAPPRMMLGAWEGQRFIGAVVFSRGASDAIGGPFGLQQDAVCELTRVALDEHAAPVTRIVAVALRKVAAECGGLRLCVSYADPLHGHIGAIYQAGNWCYVGVSKSSPMYRDATGKLWHGRQVSPKGYKVQFGQMRRAVKTADCERVDTPPKHKYLYPLDAAMRKQIEPLRKPYPKRPPDRGDLANEARRCEPDPDAPDNPRASDDIGD